MRPPRLDYRRPQELEAALALLSEHGDEARILAGGQSLMPLLNLRLAAPSLLVDINAIPGLGALVDLPTGLQVGATVRHAELLRHVSRQDGFPLLAAALPHVAHPGIRNRGTPCGSLALADPAAELPACAVCLDATLTLASHKGRRAVPAAEFFRGVFETALDPEEMILETAFPARKPGWRYAFEEVARRRGDYALAGLAGGLRIEHGVVEEARLVLFAVSSSPVRATEAERALRGARLEDPEARSAARAAVGEGIEFSGDQEYPAEYRRHLAGVVLARALEKLAREEGS